MNKPDGMRYIAVLLIALFLFVLVDKVSFPHVGPLDLFGLATLLLLALPLIDWLVFRNAKRVSPVRVYLILALALVIICWCIPQSLRRRRRAAEHIAALKRAEAPPPGDSPHIDPQSDRASP